MNNIKLLSRICSILQILGLIPIVLINVITNYHAFFAGTLVLCGFAAVVKCFLLSPKPLLISISGIFGLLTIVWGFINLLGV